MDPRVLPLLFLILVACKKDAPIPASSTYPELMEIPYGFPEMEFPEDNQFTEERWKLGKQLFYETALSVDNSISCASCHNPYLAFSDDEALSRGVKGRVGKSNTPSLTNIGYHPYLTRAGGVPGLEMQILVPIQEHEEFDFNIVELAVRLNAMPKYKEAANEAYDRDMDPFVIVRALASFERSLISGNSPYDHYTYKGDIRALNEDERKGLQLFFSEKTNCSRCHSGFNFTNYSFENNGLYKNYEDPGKMRLTKKEEDKARFKVPSLRNLSYTAPYMHDGSMNSLEEVVEHYSHGGHAHTNKSKHIKPLLLSKKEQEQLVAFLRSLDDEYFINNELFKDE